MKKRFKLPKVSLFSLYRILAGIIVAIISWTGLSIFFEKFIQIPKGYMSWDILLPLLVGVLTITLVLVFDIWLQSLGGEAKEK